MAQLTRRFHVPSALRASPLRIEADHARGLVDEGGVLVDVRRQDDPSPRIEGAVRVSPDEIPGRIHAFPRDTPIVLACT
jgi:rhodanese-related sulfurtransferase